MRIPAATAERCVKLLLMHLGEQPDRDGLRDTPGRVVRAWAEMTAGLHVDPKRHLHRQFACKSDQMVILRGIRFTSLCEHHFLPFQGVAAVGYIPSRQRVVGLSKLARVVEEYARRPQLQERIGEQVAEAIQSVLKPHGVGVHLVATHSCMGCRGVNQPEAEFVTIATRGAIRKSVAARAEFLGAVR